MIYDGIVHILDIDAQEHFNLPIAEVFKKYIHLSTIDDNNVETIDLSGRNVKITDGTGWTQLLQISRETVRSMVYVIHGGNIKGLINASSDLIIPIYDNRRSKQGFHGEVLYPYITLPISECDSYTYQIRVFNFDNDEWESFEPFRFYKLEEVNKPGYSIDSKSGFFNCSNMHLCTSDTRNRDGKESWK